MIELTTSLIMLATAFTPAIGNGATTSAVTATATPVVSQPISDDHLSTSTEAYVREYYKDTPILAEIARCESTFRQYGPDGKVLRGTVDKDDIGVMQINKYYHGDDATKLGYDIYALDGNLGYAQYLYGKYGTTPWQSSSKCWIPAEQGAGSSPDVAIGPIRS
ncbi:MAG: hypothetical protein KGI79_01210 [Patescibacteria group bacterium]|nr:hypothetical protein [Patescibacteria group bacterium]MDE2116476.1 hypothetical protein [Patescibacteria group bacterium]